MMTAIFFLFGTMDKSGKHCAIFIRSNDITVMNQRFHFLSLCPQVEMEHGIGLPLFSMT